MKLAGEYLFEAPLDVVWDALFEPEVLARTLPGCERLDREGDVFRGEIMVKMGPVQGKFNGRVEVTDLEPRDGYAMVVDGRGPAGFVKAKAKIRLASEGDSTRIHYDADVTVGGRIASVGQRLIDASSKAITKQSLEGLHAQVKALAQAAAPAASSSAAASEGPVAAGGGGEEPSPSGDAPAASGASTSGASTSGASTSGASPPAAAPARVSQAAFAMGVAREVTRELLPMRTVLLLIAVLIAAFIAYRGLT